MFWNFQANSTFMAGGRRQGCFLETDSGSLIVPASSVDIIKVVCPFAANKSGPSAKLAKLINNATEPILEEHLDGLRQRQLVEDSLVSLLFCDYTGDVQDTSTDYKDLSKIRILHLVELMNERLSSRENMKNASEGSEHAKIRGYMFLFRFMEVGERLLEGREDVAHSRDVRNRLLRFGDLETRMHETIIRAVREKGIDYVKYLSTIDKSTRIIVTRKGRLGLAPSVSQPGDVVAIIQGARAPFVLRQCDDRRRYHIVGQAYVRNPMSGEALESRGFSFEDFLIY
jgi:hypothetical protein